MELGKGQSEDLFEKLGLSVGFSDVEIGQTYPILGTITKFIDETPGKVVAEINHNIIARLRAPNAESIEVLKERAFETGIFIATVTSKEPRVEVDCKTVIFGRKQSFNA